MLNIAIIFFILAALLGTYLFTYVLQNKETPKGVALTHGPLAAIGLLILIIYTLIHPSTFLIISVILFLMAAGGGLFMMLRDLTGKTLPVWMAAGHGVAAIGGFICLIVGIFK